MMPNGQSQKVTAAINAAPQDYNIINVFIEFQATHHTDPHKWKFKVSLSLLHYIKWKFKCCSDLFNWA